MSDTTSPIHEGFHLIRRFFGAIKPGAPDESDERWARRHLAGGEVDLWNAMNNPDRRHAIDVARAVTTELPTAERPVIAAALLHDVGKIQCHFRTPARVAATLVWAVLDDDVADDWLQAGGLRRRFAQYRRHPEIGERLLIEAGADPLTSSWAADHHRPADRWRAPPEIGDVLKRCDDD